MHPGHAPAICDEGLTLPQNFGTNLQGSVQEVLDGAVQLVVAVLAVAVLHICTWGTNGQRRI